MAAATAFMLAVVAMAACWGYTVDDALIVARVASHLAEGTGYRFNNSGPPVDAVTPLGFAWVVAPFARGGPLAALDAAQWMGAAAWALGAVALGAKVFDLPGPRRRFLPLGLLGVCAPAGAWAVAGLETGLVLGLSSLALLDGWTATFALALVAGWRPELIPFAVVMSAGVPLARKEGRGRAGAAVGLVVAAALAVVAARSLLFGRPAPLAVLAKPAELGSGLYYVLAAGIWLGLPALIVAPLALRRLDRRTQVIIGACAAHFAAMALAGGDWMALFRLAVPIVPALVYVGCATAAQASRWATALRVAVAGGLCVALAIDQVPVARRVEAHRRALIARARPVLRSARRVAALDIGWVGAATDATVVDLAGVTDVTVAILPGGHTSKRLPDGFFDQRRVDALVLLLSPGAAVGQPWFESRFARVVEQRAAALASRAAFQPVAALPLGGTEQKYLILERKNGI